MNAMVWLPGGRKTKTASGLVSFTRCRNGAKSALTSGVRTLSTISPPAALNALMKVVSASTPGPKSDTSVNARLMPFFAAHCAIGCVSCGSVCETRAIYGERVVMTEVAAFMITIGFFASADTGATASALGVKPSAASVSSRIPLSSPFQQQLRRRFLAPQSQRFLHRPVRIAEQHRLLVGMVRDLAPRRHHEDIVRLPLEYAVADAAFAAAFDDAVYGAVGGAVRQTLEAGRQELDERADRGHWVAAGRGIRILHFQPVTRVRRAMTAN